MANAKRLPASKHWCFTLNDADDNLEHTDVLEIWGPHCDYLIFQEERGEEGTKHYQGYAEFTKPCRPAGLTKHFKPHWEKRRGRREQAREYCCKEATRVAGPWEHGTWSNAAQGKRSDLEDVADSIKTGKNQLEIFEEYPAATIRYYSNIEKCRNLYKPVRQNDLQVGLLFGKPGTGKTRAFWESYPQGWSLPVSKNMWFSTYQGQRHVLLDDFAGNVGLTQLLQILDRYPVLLDTKGSHTWWCPDIIIITSNIHPFDWYDYSSRTDSYAALKRRVHKVVIYNDDGSNEEVDKEEFFENSKPAVGRFTTPQQAWYY